MTFTRLEPVVCTQLDLFDNSLLDKVGWIEDPVPSKNGRYKVFYIDLGIKEVDGSCLEKYKPNGTT